MSDLFFWTSLLSTGLVTAVLILIFFTSRHLYIRPSVLILLFFNLRIQWASVVKSDYIYEILDYPLSYWLLTHGLPWIILLLLIFSRKSLSKKVWQDVFLAGDVYESREIRQASILMFLVFAVLVGFYLYHVPFDKTGLYTIITNPENAGQAREESLKLVSNVLVRYSYSWVRDVIGPLAGALITLQLIQMRSKLSKLIHLPIYLVGLIFILVGVSFPGARAGIASVVFTVLITYWIKEKMPFRLRYVIVGFLLVLTGPIILTILREGKIVSLDRFVDLLFGPVFLRVFLTPMKTGLWYVDYVQTNGFVGISGVRPLALAFGEKFINLPNVIGLSYIAHPLLTVSANTCFIYDFYACFGLLSIPLSILVWFALDLFLLAFRYPSPVTIAIVAVLWLRSNFFISGAYLVNLISHGIFLLFFFTILWQWKFQKHEGLIYSPGGKEVDCESCPSQFDPCSG